MPPRPPITTVEVGEPESTAAAPVALALPTTAGKTPEQIEKERRIAELKEESLLTYCDRAPDYFAQSMLLTAIISFGVTAWIVRKRASSNQTMALALVVPLPLFVGCYGFVYYLSQSADVIYLSGVAPEPSEVAGAVATALGAIRYGILLSTPAFVLTLGFALARATKGEQSR